MQLEPTEKKSLRQEYRGIETKTEEEEEEMEERGSKKKKEEEI